MNYGNKQQHRHRVYTVVTRLLKRGGSNQRLLSLVFAFAVAQGSIYFISPVFLSRLSPWLTSLTPRSTKVLFVKLNHDAFSVPHKPLAYEDVRSNKSDINWVLVDYEVRP